jgi:hypothetical protein
MKMALGLFHFNPHWGGDSRMGRRHCAEALGPFLRLLRARPTWRVDIEMSGAGLENVQRAYPEEFRLLRLLVERGQVELISSLYTPSVWIAFPRRDLLRSVEVNRRCLAKLGLPWTRIFFAQEAFFGMGVSALHEHFDIAVCKDDYLAHQYDLNYKAPRFTLKGMKVVVASSHLLSEVALTLQQKGEQEFRTKYRVSESHIRHLHDVREISEARNFPGSRCFTEGHEWLWYHCGDGNHITAVHKPHDLEKCYYDSTWKELCVSQVESYVENGYQLCHIGELAKVLDYSEAEELPPLLEGSWNPKRAEGVFCWMGRNSTQWEDDAAVLTAIMRARSRLVTAEEMVVNRGESSHIAALEEKLERGWLALFAAQVSDGLGWDAGARAVSNSLRASDEALLLANQTIEELEEATTHDNSDPFDTITLCGCPAEKDTAPSIAPEIFGAEGCWSAHLLSTNIRLYEFVFTPSSERGQCGVRFPFDTNELVFCPSGLEDHVITVDLARLKPTTPTLPLANGLIEIASARFLIKETLSVHVAAMIDRSNKAVIFAVAGCRKGKRYEWRFFLVSGTPEYAVLVANTINRV